MAYQDQVDAWMQACFGPAISGDKTERNFRFGEEALELLQAMDCTEEEVMALVRYVWGRPKGEPAQEVGGVMVCLSALCNAAEIDLSAAAGAELTRCWEKIDKIRAKHAAKPVGIRTALPGRLPTCPLSWCNSNDAMVHKHCKHAECPMIADRVLHGIQKDGAP